jgi:hypothetical protein
MLSSRKIINVKENGEREKRWEGKVKKRCSKATEIRE